MTKTTQTDRELILTRLLSAPRDLVFDAWTKPEHLAHWFGPNDFTLTTHEMEARVGGVWRFILHGPDGTNFPNKVIFTTIKRPERLEYSHSGEGVTADINFSVKVLFEEDGDNTRLTMHMVFPRAEQFQRVAREFGAIEGAEQTLQRLADYVISMG